jgi:hypothetical protein
MDPNRNMEESCENLQDDCITAYKDYHSLIETQFKSKFIFNKRTSLSYQQALIVDIHGQTHPELWIELGYLIRKNELDLPYLPNSLSSSVSVMSSLSKKYSLDEIIRGNFSLGGIMQHKYNLKTVPSPLYPSPQNNSYYNGGHITSAHGSYYPTPYRVNAIQMELPKSMRSDLTYEDYAKKIASCLYDYYFIHSFDKLF